MDNWFPLSKSMMEDCVRFTKLTPSEKVFWFSILSEVNLVGDFYRADLEWAIAVALSISKVRQARRKFQAYGWLKVTPGRYVAHRRLATSYHFAEWARPQRGNSFAQLSRYVWDQILRELRAGRLYHRDLVVYAFLSYFWQKFGGEDNAGIFVTKHQIREATNLPRISDSLKRLNSRFGSVCGFYQRLMEYAESYRRFEIRKWATCAGPDESEYAASRHAETQTALRKAIAKARALQDNN